MELLGDFLRVNKVPKEIFNKLLRGETITYKKHTYCLEVTVATESDGPATSFIGAGAFNMVLALTKDEILKVALFIEDHTTDSTDNPERFIRLMREQPFTNKADTAYRLTSCTITANLTIDGAEYQTTITQQAAITPKEEIEKIDMTTSVIIFALNYAWTNRMTYDFFIAGNISKDGNIVDPTYSSEVRPKSPGGIKAQYAFRRNFTEKFLLQYDRSASVNKGIVLTAMAFILATQGLTQDEILEYRFPKESLREGEQISALNSTPFKDIARNLKLPSDAFIEFINNPYTDFKPEALLNREQVTALQEIFNKVAELFATVTTLQQEEKYDEVLRPKDVSVASFFAAVKENAQPPANANKP